MNFQRLLYFLTLAKFESFTEAAEDLYISQPALSKQISLLESEIGVKLLNRTTKKVELTFAGSILVSEGRKLVEQEQNMLHRIRIAGGVESAELTVGTMTSWAETALPVFFRKFQEENPNVNMTMQRYNYSSLFQRLDDGAIDLGFVRVFDAKELKNYKFKQMHTSHIAVLTNREHPFASMDEVLIPMLRDEPILMMRQKVGNNIYHNDLSQLCFQYSFKPNVVREYDLVESIYFMVRTGRYISLLSDDLEENLSADLKMTPLQNSPTLCLMAVWNKRSTNPYLQDFIKMLPGGAESVGFD